MRCFFSKSPILHDTTRIVADSFYRASFFDDSAMVCRLHVGSLKGFDGPIHSCAIFNQRCNGQSGRYGGTDYQVDPLASAEYRRLKQVFEPDMKSNYRVAWQQDMAATIECIEMPNEPQHTYRRMEHELLKFKLLGPYATQLLIERLLPVQMTITEPFFDVLRETRRFDISDDVIIDLIFEELIDSSLGETGWKCYLEIPDFVQVLQKGHKELDRLVETQPILNNEPTQLDITGTIFWRYAEGLLRLQTAVDRTITRRPQLPSFS